MTRALILAAALGAFLGACTDVPDLERGDCGNRIIEAGEDCDGFAEAGLTCGQPASDEAGKATQCFFVCEPADDTPACPPNWECGDEGRCREPTKTFDQDGATTLPFPVEEFAVGDVNGDGYEDLVGNQSSLVSMRLGSATAILAGKVDVQTPEPIGPLLFSYIDNDSLFDVIVPILDGLFTLAGDARTSLEPVPYASLALNPLGGFRALTVEAFTGNNDRDREILAFTNDGMVFFEAASSSALAFPGQGSSFATLVNDIGVGNIDGDALGEVALAFDKKNVVHICEGRVDSSGLERSLQVVCDDTAAVVNPIAAAGGTRFADVNGDRLLDLLVSVTVNDTMQVEVLLNNGAGGFATGVVSQVFSGGSASPRPNPWPIAVADLDDDNADDYVFSNEIVLVADSGAAVPQSGNSAVKAASDTWSSAAITDINGDDRLDVAVGLERANRIDFFVNSRAGADVVFNKFPLNLDARPRLLRAGDFDGDLVGDVAFVLGVPNDEQPNQVAVSFGNTSGSSSPAAVMGSFGTVEVLEPIETSLGINDFDTITDLAVVFSTEEPKTRLANVLRGSSLRRMLSPFFLFNEQEQFDQPQGLVLGNFASRAGEASSAPDLLVITEFASRFRAWLLTGTGVRAGLLATGGQLDVTTVTGFDFGCALWRAADLDGAPGDEVVGMDGRLGCDNAGGDNGGTMLQLEISAGAFDGNDPNALAPGVSELGEGFVNLRSLKLHDMDLDGRLDVVALFQGDAQAGIDSVAVVLWNDGGKFDASRRAEIRFPGMVFYDAAPIQYGSETPELLLLSDEYIFHVLYNASAGRLYGVPDDLFEKEGGVGHLAAADINGDGLSDIVYTNGEDARVILQIAAPPLGDQNPGSSQDGGP